MTQQHKSEIYTDMWRNFTLFIPKVYWQILIKPHVEVWQALNEIHKCFETCSNDHRNCKLIWYLSFVWRVMNESFPIIDLTPFSFSLKASRFIK